METWVSYRRPQGGFYTRQEETDSDDMMCRIVVGKGWESYITEEGLLGMKKKKVTGSYTLGECQQS